MSRSQTIAPARSVLLLAAAAALLGVAAWRGLVSPPPAYGQIPDSGAQRELMLREMRLQTEKLSEIAVLLREIRDRQPPPAKPEKSAGG